MQEVAMMQMENRRLSHIDQITVTLSGDIPGERKRRKAVKLETQTLECTNAS